MPKRKSDAVKNACGNVMVGVVILALCFVYYVFVVLNWIPRLKREEWIIISIIVLIAFHLLAFLLIWSFIQTMITDPGEVPIYWGFRVGDPDDRRRRYWLMCNLYKPERCHHCSACGRWILNMDHHCPWVNNWIGFWNRKYFMLLLFYVQITTLYVLIALSYDMYKSIVWIGESIINFEAPHLYELQIAVFTMIAYLFVALICLLMFVFFRFHRKLVRENKTTIENLEHKNKEYESKYDINECENIEQVMGTIRWLWFLPIMPASTKPHGEGINFHKRFESEDSEGEGESEEKNKHDNDAQRNPANFGGRGGQDSLQGNQGNPQNNVLRSQNQNNQVGKPGENRRTENQAIDDKNGENNETITKQGDKMTIHNDRGSQWKNLNNIVRSDNPNQVYKSSESDQNNSSKVQPVGLGGKRHTNVKPEDNRGRTKQSPQMEGQQEVAKQEEQKQLRVIIYSLKNYSFYLVFINKILLGRNKIPTSIKH